jgi:4-amino-4-deoxy-L-arabinose transferase-like glycosyltransferase
MTGEVGSRRVACFALLVILLAFALRAHHLDFQSLWRDEVDALRFATRPLPQMLATFRSPGENGPLYFLLLRGWLAFSGRSEFALRSLSLLCGVLAVPLTIRLGRHLLGPQAAQLAGLLIATSPYLIWYSQEAKMYALTVALVLAALYAFWGAVTRGGWGRWLLCWLLTTLSIYVHLLSVWLILVQIVWFITALVLRPRARRQAVPMLVMLALLTLPYLPIVRWQLKLWLRPAFQTGHSFVPLPTMVTTLLWGFSRGVQSGASLWALLPFVFLLLGGAVLTTKSSDAADDSTAVPSPVASTRPRAAPLASWMPARLLLIAWIAIPILAVYLVSLSKPLFTDRYLIWIAPGFYLLLATGLTALWQRWRPLGTALLILILALNAQAIWGQANTTIKSDFRSAASYVEQRRAPGELLLFLMPYARHTYAYYAHDAAPWAEAPFTNAGGSAELVDAELIRITTGRDAVWLIRSEPEMWDSRELTPSWLEAHGSLTDEAHFVRVQAFRYTLTAP